MKTNITIVSNIFNRADSDIRRDLGFIAQVIGRTALQKLKKKYGSTFDGIRLSNWQENMYSQDKGCSRAKNGEITHGLVRKDGRLVWEGRCEYSQCEGFSRCGAAAHYIRASAIRNDCPECDVSPLTYEWLGDIEPFYKEDAFEEQISEETVPPEVVIEDVKAFVAQDEYEKIDSPTRIIEDTINSKILVNAAPGSGKTYTVMRRLEYILRHELVYDFSSVLVLVYTNAAKNEILSRLEAGVLDGTLPYSARNVDVCTFDSLATSYLATIEALFVHLDYNGRIRLFNEKFVAENFSNFVYVIVDELQDLVNERAKMALNILGALTGGYLLLGDKCQAIYDYDCHEGDNVSSVDFYKRLSEIIPTDVKRFELVGNQRQIDRLALVSDNLRCALVGFDPPDANELIADELRNIETIGRIERFDFHRISERSAILCRNNGEAEYVSHLLYKKGVRHILLRGVGQSKSLNRYIADCLWDYHADVRITRSVFVERYYERVEQDEEKASCAFNALSEVAYEEVRETIELEKLVQALNKPTDKLGARLANETADTLTVSTIHKAKGREFDTVYLIDSGFTPSIDNTEESRVWYVGCTRAKKNLYKLDKTSLYLKRSTTYSLRWLQLNNHRVRWTQRLLTHCRNIVLGLPIDFSETGFVEGDLSTALQIQEYIAEKVNVGDTVEIVLVNSRYQIRHLDYVVGYLAEGMYNQLGNIVRESNPVSNAPPYLSSVYVSNIVTITPSSFPDGVAPYFRESRLWLGLELSGFPRINWNYAHSVEVPRNDWQPNAYSDWSTLK